MRTGLAAGFGKKAYEVLEGVVLNGGEAHRMSTRGAGVCGQATRASLDVLT